MINNREKERRFRSFLGEYFFMLGRALMAFSPIMLIMGTFYRENSSMVYYIYLLFACLFMGVVGFLILRKGLKIQDELNKVPRKLVKSSYK